MALTFKIKNHLSLHPTAPLHWFIFSIAFVTILRIIKTYLNYLIVHYLSLISSVQSFSLVRLFATPWTAACQASLSFTISQSLLKLMRIELVMPSNHLIFCCPFSYCSQSFLASGSFPMSWLFESGSQSTGILASASVLPMNIQD